MSNTKLTKYQNDRITYALCAMAINGHDPDTIKRARQALVKECSEMNGETAETEPDKYLAIDPEYSGGKVVAGVCDVVRL